MKSSTIRWIPVRLAFTMFASLWAPSCMAAPQNSWSENPSSVVPMARGVVYEDHNRNGKRDPGEPGIPGAAVSNGDSIVETDSQGRWSLELTSNTILFVCKPSGYSLPVNSRNLPRFYYIHKPDGSPPRKYPGAPPTGPLPESVDFPLYKEAEPENFTVIILSDIQTAGPKEVGYLEKDVFPELVGYPAVFGAALGDTAFNRLDIYDAYTRAASKLGFPLYHVLGNHDMNHDSPDDEGSHETFSSWFGPVCYSFDYSKVHFVVLDSIIWKGKGEGGDNYRNGLTPQILRWLSFDLARTPKDRLVVFMTHIPIPRGGNHPKAGWTELFNLVKDRPRILALSGHTHSTEHHFLGPKDGWMGTGEFHEMICTTASGTWWQGPKDRFHIPKTDQRDGTPNGYTILEFKGTNYVSTVKGARMDRNEQMRIWIPEVDESETSPSGRLLVNVFDGCRKTRVDYRLDQDDWKRMTHKPQVDPLMRSYYSHPRNDGKPPREVGKSAHIWESEFPKKLTGGPHVITVRVVDIYGREWKQTRNIP